MKKIVYRSAINGLFVKKEFALKNPDTTIKETIEVKPRKKK